MCKKKITIVFFSFLIVCFLFSIEPISSADRSFAEDEFRRGVQSYYRGSFNDAILLFENALEAVPTSNLIIDWLGKAYYHSGLEGTALSQWMIASEAGYGGLLLKNRIEIVKNRRISQRNLDGDISFVENGSFSGIDGESIYYFQPTSLLPLEDGSFWLVAYGSNELLKIDVNGKVLISKEGSFAGFDRPMDIVKTAENKLLVSEYAGDRIAVLDENGNYEKSFGLKGISDGELLGPQYMALDSSGNIFVSDFGNARVCVFSGIADTLGTYLFSFGNFISPSGISIIDDIVYVADSISGAIYSYDVFGNYIDYLVPEKTFKHPEALRAYEHYLLVTDGRTIYTVDTRNGSVFETGTAGVKDTSLTTALFDVNGNILATDFTTSQIYVMSKMTELVGGMFVQIERVHTDQFPKVTIEVKVENRNRTPVSGLKASNFLVTEEKRTVAECVFEGSYSKQDFCDIAIVIDEGAFNTKKRAAVETAVREIAKSMEGKGTLTLLKAGTIPIIEYSGSPISLERFEVSDFTQNKAGSASLDLAIRLAGNQLINGARKKAIVYLCGGITDSDNFAKYSLSDISSYLNNNAIAFLSVSLEQGALDSGIQYITDQTPGSSYYVYRPTGLLSLASDIISLQSGLYQFSYISSLPIDFGRKYLNVEVETYLLNRSGRDEAGYFAPLK